MPDTSSPTSRWSLPRIPLRQCVLLVFMLISSMWVMAQQPADTSDKVRITLIHSDNLIHNKTDSGEYNRFIGAVIMQQGTDTLYCDSAYQNGTTKNFEAFNDVRIAQQDGTQGTSDYLKYTAASKTAFMQGNVKLTDGKNHLECTELTYDLNTKIGVYDKGGTLHNDSTTVVSNAGVYDSKTKDSHFTGNVFIDDPQYKIHSEDLIYNTETKLTEFFARSTVLRDSGRGLLQTVRGTYDGRNGIAHFVGHSSIWNDGQYIEGDTLNYNKITGYGLAVGNVISWDTAQHSWMYCGFAEYHQRQRKTLATGMPGPVLVQANGKDTLYMRADTFYSAPMIKVQGVYVAGPAARSVDTMRYDSMHVNEAVVNGHSVADTTRDHTFDDVKRPLASTRYMIPGAKREAGKSRKGGKRKKPEEVSVVTSMNTDTAEADSTAPLYFIGYHHVRIFSDSLQGKCDSIVYTRADSLIRMIYAPIAWAHNSQITGDTIIMQLDSDQLRKMFVPNNAFLVSQSGPAKAQLFDQVQGKTLTAYFKNNDITKMIVYPNSELIYYPKDEKGYYMGVDQGSSVRMRIQFENQKINNMKFDPDVKMTMTPLEKADLPNMKLSRYKWLIDQRPKNKNELFW
jgi:lipopolysaccharide export system protein LptA